MLGHLEESHERFWFPSGATHEKSVNVLHFGVGGKVVRIHAAAVKQGMFAASSGEYMSPENFSNPGVLIVHIRRIRRFASDTDCPSWFICEHDFAEMAPWYSGERGLSLPCEDLHTDSLLLVGTAFANAD